MRLTLSSKGVWPDIPSLLFDCICFFVGLSPPLVVHRSQIIHLTDSERYQLASSVGSAEVVLQLSFPQQRVRMVRTRSRATSPSRQGSKGASSDPQCDRQSAPAMQTSSVQHVQSMAATMAELTRQNQELRMEINQRRQTREEHE